MRIERWIFPLPSADDTERALRVAKGALDIGALVGRTIGGWRTRRGLRRSNVVELGIALLRITIR